jgi:hypothetical protein
MCGVNEPRTRVRRTCGTATYRPPRRLGKSEAAEYELRVNSGGLTPAAARYAAMAQSCNSTLSQRSVVAIRLIVGLTPGVPVLETRDCCRAWAHAREERK